MQLFIDYPSWLRPEVIPGLLVPRWYSLAYILGFYLTYLLMRRDIRQGKLPYSELDLTNFIWYCIIGMLLGSRLFYVTFYDPDRAYYLTHPWMIYWPFRSGNFVGLSGLSYHGAVLGIAAAMFVYSWRKKQSFFHWSDASTAALPLGYTLGRLGNFTNAELYGRATALPWGIRFPHAETLPSSLPWVKELAAQVGLGTKELNINLPRHPSQLYEALGEGIILWVLLYLILRPRQAFVGSVSWCYLIGYGAIRFLLEYFRQPDSQLGYIIEAVPGDYRHFVSFANLSMGQLLSLAMVFSGIAGLLLRRAYLQRHKP